MPCENKEVLKSILEEKENHNEIYSEIQKESIHIVSVSSFTDAFCTNLRDVFAHEDMAEVTRGVMHVNIPRHDTRIFILLGEKRKLRSVYEAETAWLQRYQCLGINNSLGYAKYGDASFCSGGGKVEWLGNHKDNYMEWRNIYSKEDGTYTMKLCYATGENRSVYCKVNGSEDFEIKTPGDNKKIVKTIVRNVTLGRQTAGLMTTMSSSYSPSLTHQHVLPIQKQPVCVILLLR